MAKNKVAEAFKDIREALKARADAERDVTPELIDAGLTILEQIVRDLHDVAEYCRDENKRRAGS